MREILFRIKDRISDDWYYGYPTTPISKSGTVCFVGKDEQGRTYYNAIADAETLCQYTGLTDNNREKIFEGDICKVAYIDKRCNSIGEQYFAENVIIEEVVFYKGTFCFKTIVEDIPMYRPIGFEIYEKQKIKYFEIIGNIYDNSEVLKGLRK